MSLSGKNSEGMHTNDYRKDIHTLPKTTNNDRKIVRTHLIDGIYEGLVNASYQRDGFGILQTDDFQTYVGHFKYNKPNGLGLIFYSDGSIIYGNFQNGQLQGIGLADNGMQIQIGTFKGASLVGIGFDYSYQQGSWKMNSYHKGVSIEVIRQEMMTLQEGIPNILTLQSHILSHYLNFTKKRFFSKPDLLNTENKEDLSSFYIHKLNNQQYFFGCMIGNQHDGLGLVYDFKTNTPCEAGTYCDGILQGYGAKIDRKVNFQEIGFFEQGKRQGIFRVIQGGKAKFTEFRKGTLVVEDQKGETVQSFRKRQKIYYYRQKDFLSTRHNLDLQCLKVVFESSEYKAWKIQQQADRKQKMDQPKGSNQGKTKSKPGVVIAGVQGIQKTSLQIMKEKIFGMMSQTQSKKNKNEKASILFQKENEDVEKNKFEKNHQDDEIAVEESPIAFMGTQKRPKKRNVTFQQT